MAKKPSASKGGADKAATKNIEDRLIDTMLDLAAREGWQSVTLSAIAEGAGVKLSELYPAWRSRMAVLAAFMRRIDREVVESDFGFTPDDIARDRLFEVLMRRFDALQIHRKAVLRIRTEIMRDPAASAAMLGQLGCSMAWMLQAAGLSSDGVAGKVKIAGLTGLWMRCAATWARDDSEDMSQTMAELDRGLKQADRWAGAIFHKRRPGFDEKSEAA
ncbi:MAG: TetR family transcriptional regulator [Alphaproteobacteria bacterium]|nr:TetR family transcriptional regulator [Alphaproteobacteria bacterium]